MGGGRLLLRMPQAGVIPGRRGLRICGPSVRCSRCRRAGFGSALSGCFGTRMHAQKPRRCSRSREWCRGLEQAEVVCRLVGGFVDPTLPFGADCRPRAVLASQVRSKHGAVTRAAQSTRCGCGIALSIK